MRRIQYWIRNFFGFSRTETNGLLILLPLMIMLILSRPLYQMFILNRSPDKEELQRNLFLDSLVAHWDFNPPTTKEADSSFSLFNFNPNTASKQELQKLGLAPYLAQRIANYRSKGGVFYHRDDLLKIYGMDSSWYHRVFSFIVIPVAHKRKANRPTPYPSTASALKKKFNLNTIDSIQLQFIPGIGPVLASRIVRYRNILGGFIKKEQVKEVYGLKNDIATTVTQHLFITSNFTPQRVDINASTKVLSQHPYITYKVAKLINIYRFQHGNFKTVNDLLNIDVIDSAFLNRIGPYLKVVP